MIAKSKNLQTCDKPKSESINNYSLRKANTKSQQRKSKIIYFFVVYFKKEFIHTQQVNVCRFIRVIIPKKNLSILISKGKFSYTYFRSQNNSGKE